MKSGEETVIKNTHYQDYKSTQYLCLNKFVNTDSGYFYYHFLFCNGSHFITGKNLENEDSYILKDGDIEKTIQTLMALKSVSGV